MTSLIERLGARALKNSQDAGAAIREFERRMGFQLPAELFLLLAEVEGAVVFDRGAWFVPLVFSGRESGNGRLSLEVLYGGARGPNGLAERYDMLKHELPAGIFSIGEAPGGDQICLEKKSQKVLFWKHDVSPDKAITEIASDVASFFEALEPELGIGNSSDREVIDKESFLDF